MCVYACLKSGAVLLCAIGKNGIARIRLVAALGLLIPGLVLVGGAGAASATTAPPPGHTIKSASALPIVSAASGGGGAIDFWKVSLYGGDVVQFAAKYQGLPAYTFALYPPGTNDANFSQAVAASSATTTSFDGYPEGTVSVQAPYNGTFILAVCENVLNNNCDNVDAGSGTNPMDKYKFSSTYTTKISPTVAAKETKPSATISAARTMGLGHFESGGGGAIDFWKVSLYGGDVVQFAAKYQGIPAYTFALYPPGTNDANFSQAVAASSATTTSFDGYPEGTVKLKAPHNGTFILAVCENVLNNNCDNVDAASGTNPMDTYTFITTHTGGRETRTSLKSSASIVTYGHEKSLKLSAKVTALFGGSPTGEVTISDGKKTVCTVKLVTGKGTCSPATNKLIPAGKYSLIATYAGKFLGSKSSSMTLTVRK